ncbi:LmrA/YxaF family transcription factor [Nocardia africana]
MAVAVEDAADAEEGPREAAAAAFTRWTELLAASLRDHGAGETDAERIATLTVAAVEGSMATCRAEFETIMRSQGPATRGEHAARSDHRTARGSG